MELVGKITALCVTAALLALVVKKGAPEIAMVLVLAAAAMALAALWPDARALTALISDLRRSTGLDSAWFIPLYKTVAIAVVVRIGGDLCRDAGEQALAGVVETAGAVCALAAAAPLMQMVLSRILELMQ